MEGGAVCTVSCVFWFELCSVIVWTLTLVQTSPAQFILTLILPFNFSTAGSKELNFSFQLLAVSIITTIIFKCRFCITFCADLSVYTHVRMSQLLQLLVCRQWRFKWMWVFGRSIGRYVWKFQVLKGPVLSLDCVYTVHPCQLRHNSGSRPWNRLRGNVMPRLCQCEEKKYKRYAKRPEVSEKSGLNKKFELFINL